MTRNVMTQMVSTNVQVSFGSVRASSKITDASFKDAVNTSLKKDANAGTKDAAQAKPKDVVSDPQSTGKAVKTDNAKQDNTAVKAADDQPVVVNPENEIPSEEDLKEVMEELAGIMMQFASNLAAEVLNVPVNEITDWLQGKNLELVDLLSKDTDYQMLLDFTGMNDISGLLTNEDAFVMMTQIDVKVESLYVELGIPNDEDFIKSFIKEFKDLEGKFPVIFKPLDLNPEKVVVSEENDDAANVMIADTAEVVTENSTETFEETFAKTETDTKKEETVKTEVKNDHVSFNTFFEKLTDAVDKLTGADNAARFTGINELDVLNQVMDHIKADINPDSTSLEFMLNPESLGRVAVTVTDKGGNMTAKISCENQVAKENLEAQLITLKQTFEEQGLKVESVEINVSDFNFTRDEEETKDNGEGDKKKHKRTLSLDEIDARLNAAEGEQEETMTRRIDPRLYGYRVDYFG